MKITSIRNSFIGAIFGTMLLISGCASVNSENSSKTNGQGQSGQVSKACELPNDLVRLKTVPVGVLMPSGSLERQSYTSATDLTSAGLNSVSLGFEFYFTPTGEIVFDFNGNADENAKERWLNNLRCSVIELKQAGLVVAVWGQFIEAGRRGEPGEVAQEVQKKVLDGALELMPEIGKLLEELKVEFWAPVSELERFAGIENHNKYFPQFVNAGRPHFTGVMYVQPNILQRDGFVVQKIEPDLGGVDALGISWISFECEKEKLPPGFSVESADFYIDAATKQGISRVFISELGGINAADDSAKPCLEKLITTWKGADNGVFLLDMPSDFPNGSQIKNSWQEDVLRAL